MKIITPGIPPAKDVEFHCRRCGCVFRAPMDGNEALRVTDRRDGDYFMCICPTEGCAYACTKSVR